MDVYYLHFQYYHAGVEWGTLCSGNHYLCECVYYFFMLLLAAFTEYQKNGGQREVFKMDTFLPDGFVILWQLMTTEMNLPKPRPNVRRGPSLCCRH